MQFPLLYSLSNSVILCPHYWSDTDMHNCRLLLLFSSLVSTESHVGCKVVTSEGLCFWDFFSQSSNFNSMRGLLTGGGGVVPLGGDTVNLISSYLEANASFWKQT